MMREVQKHPPLEPAPMQRAALQFLEDSMSKAIVKDLFLEEGDPVRVDLARVETDGTCYIEIT